MALPRQLHTTHPSHAHAIYAQRCGVSLSNAESEIVAAAYAKCVCGCVCVCRYIYIHTWGPDTRATMFVGTTTVSLTLRVKT